MPKKSILPFSYYTGLEEALPVDIASQIPDTYAYLWVKASQCHGLGFELFRKRDALKYPLKEWESEVLMTGVEQIVYQLGGITPERYISQPRMEDVEHLMMTFHFKVGKIEKIINKQGEAVYEVVCRHIVLAQGERSPYIFNLYFRLTQI